MTNDENLVYAGFWIRVWASELHANPLVAQFDVLSYLSDWLVKLFWLKASS